jgi:uncharacterized protein YjbI with pentapeptide repeats
MNREETLALYAQGKDAWNAWAEKMLAERAEMERMGKWAVEKSFLVGVQPDNERTAEWFDAADVDFSKHKFEGQSADFRGWTFPGAATFNGASFLGLTSLDGATFSHLAWFAGARFSGDVWFDGAKFLEDAVFIGATFSEQAIFDLVTVSGDAVFSSAIFAGHVVFDGATFSGDVAFLNATFLGDVSFEGATFAKGTEFTDATLKRNLRFSGAKFEGSADFSRAVFRADADFSSVKSNVGITLSDARFARVPDLLQTELHREPRLDNVRVRRTWFGPQVDWRSWFTEADHQKPKHIIRRLRLPFTIDRNAPAKFRELKGYAIDGEDSVRELEFHAQEIRSSRFVSDWPWHLRFWLGYLYSTFSDFGRSLLRPLVLWVAIIAISAAIYLGGNSTVAAARQNLQPTGWWSTLTSYAQSSLDAWRNGSPCETRTPALADDIRAATNAPAEALRLAFSNAFVLFDTAGGDAGRRTYGCLYGLEQNGGGTVPIVPGFVSDWSKVQRLLSAVCIFLFGLALRNMLKLK